jgi:hypothetical protein
MEHASLASTDRERSFGWRRAKILNDRRFAMGFQPGSAREVISRSWMFRGGATNRRAACGGQSLAADATCTVPCNSLGPSNQSGGAVTYIGRMLALAARSGLKWALTAFAVGALVGFAGIARSKGQCASPEQIGIERLLTVVATTVDGVAVPATPAAGMLLLKTEWRSRPDFLHTQVFDAAAEGQSRVIHVVRKR